MSIMIGHSKVFGSPFGKERYSKMWVDYPGKGKITDADVAAFVKKHTHWWDRFDYHKVSDSALLAQNILMGVVEEPKEKNWKF